MKIIQYLMMARIHKAACSLVAGGLVFAVLGCAEESPQTTAPSADQSGPANEPNQSENANRRVNTGADIANEPLLASASGSTVLEFDVVGMTCAGCAGTITTAANSIPNVEKVRISLVHNKAWVVVAGGEQSNDNTPLSTQAVDNIIAAIAAAGDYEATIAAPQSPDVPSIDQPELESGVENEDG